MAARPTRRSHVLWTWDERFTRRKRTRVSAVRVRAPALETCCWVHWLLARKSLARWWPQQWEYPTESIDVTVEGDLDLQGTLGISKEAAVGFESIRVNFDVRAPKATQEQLSALQVKTEQYCVVMQTLQHPPRIENKWKQ